MSLVHSQKISNRKCEEAVPIEAERTELGLIKWEKMPWFLWRKFREETRWEELIAPGSFVGIGWEFRARDIWPLKLMFFMSLDRNSDAADLDERVLLLFGSFCPSLTPSKGQVHHAWICIWALLLSVLVGAADCKCFLRGCLPHNCNDWPSETKTGRKISQTD